ncbi:tetratricopeptide repeat protein [Piscinibacter gummiphilus]|uniref:protein O-GlcNAc transferase n=1 Tax=Piscinibacter gummiphilus TaxID=946333 RepID=A0ABZ0D644_9BURK|nr:tetratricopeptide repeat protein [Piscinibacter gummiphilus]WOB10139.1 tetratricopeptide repeat protein [Piscinibacter gummiphilus]
MKKSTAKPPLVAASPAAAVVAVDAPSELDRELALARSGTMGLGDLMNRSQLLAQDGKADAAAELYEAWIAHTVSPLLHVACFNWGTLLGNLNRMPEAERAYQRALALSPGFHQARLNLGHQLERQGRPAEALAEWQKVADQPGVEEELLLHALNNMARLLETQRRYDEALACMVRSLEFKATQNDVIQHYVHLRQKMCAWPVYQPVGDVTLNRLLMGTSALAMLGESDDPALQLLAAQRFVNERLPRQQPEPFHKSGPRREGKIRIGYLSGDLHMHAVGLLSVELLELHDRERFEVYAFSWSRDDGSPLRARIRAAIDHYVPIGGLDDATAARVIAQHGIDVLVDLQGLTSGARPAIVGMRPAPIQVSYLGLPGTCALPGVDWILADRFVMPPELLPYMTEKPIYVPSCYQVSDRKREVGPTPKRADYGLPEDAFVFCSFNNTFKFTPALFKSWMRMLQQVPKSVLWLLADNEWALENLRREADAHGIARDRLILAPRVQPPEYLARFQLADLMLDTFPYNAGTTASDALWMGLPIVTYSGRSYISRMAGSLLTAVGLPDLVTFTLADYEKLAVQLGNNPLRVASYKRYLNEQGRQSKLFDVPQLVRDIEHEFERLALEHRAT